MSPRTASIPVDLTNPGQVLACMGFLEATEVLLGGAEAHFDWSEARARFVPRAEGDSNPFEVVLEFLSKAKISELKPMGYVVGGAADGGGDESDDDDLDEGDESDDDDLDEVEKRDGSKAFPSGEGDRNALPILLADAGRRLTVTHWADGSSRDDFKLYAGNRSAERIATQMLQGVRAKARKNQSVGDLKYLGLQQLWQEQREALLEAPFDVVTPMRGSFNFDARGAWTAIDAGYSPNTQNDGIAASPVVEILAAIGLEHTRPHRYESHKVRYAVWGHPLPPMLGRAALSGTDLKLPTLRFEFTLDRSGDNKVTTFAQQENLP